MNYIPWNPVNDLNEYLWFQSSLDNINSPYELVLKFRGEKTGRILQVAFKIPLSYQKTSSFDLVNAGDIYRGALLQIENSSYLQWFAKMSEDNWSSHKITHYSFRTNNYVIDVLSAHDVKVEWLDS